MKFWLIMLFVAWRLRWLSWCHPEFRRKLKNRNVIMQWRTKAGRPARWFHFSYGRVISSPGMHAKANITLKFEDATYAAAVLIDVLDNQHVFVSGIKKGKIKLTGRPGGLMWFITLTNYLLPGGVRLWWKKERHEVGKTPRRFFFRATPKTGKAELNIKDLG